MRLNRFDRLRSITVSAASHRATHWAKRFEFVEKVVKEDCASVRLTVDGPVARVQGIRRSCISCSCLR